MAVSTVYVYGPTQVYLKFGDSGAWTHLGMCEGDMSIELNHMYQGVQIDGSGMGDYDRQWMGATASISGDLSFWKEPVLDQLKVGFGDLNITAGQWPNGSIGTMMRTEGVAMSLVLTSAYASKSAYADNGAQGVWYFPAVFSLPFRRNHSTRATRERLAFEAIPIHNGLGACTLFYRQIAFSLPVPT